MSPSPTHGDDLSPSRLPATNRRCSHPTWRTVEYRPHLRLCRCRLYLQLPDDVGESGCRLSCYAMPCHAYAYAYAYAVFVHVHVPCPYCRHAQEGLLSVRPAHIPSRTKEHRATRRANLQEHTQGTRTGTWSRDALTCKLQHAGESRARPQPRPCHAYCGVQRPQRPVNVNKCMQRSDRPASHIVCHGDCGTLDGADGV